MVREIDETVVSEGSFEHWASYARFYAPEKLIDDAVFFSHPHGAEEFMPHSAMVCHVVSALALAGGSFADLLSTDEKEKLNPHGKKLHSHVLLGAVRDSLPEGRAESLAATAQRWGGAEIAALRSFREMERRGNFWVGLKTSIYHLAAADLSLAVLTPALTPYVSNSATEADTERGFLSKVAAVFRESFEPRRLALVGHARPLQSLACR